MAKANNSYMGPGDRRYITTVMNAPILERQYEMALGRRWRDDRDEDALHEIITAHVRLVVRIAAGFRGYGLPPADLIQEGNIGLLEAANRFDPERNVRFSTYATWWILAAIQEYIVRNSTIVRIGTTPAQKSLFFNLRRLRARFGGTPVRPMTDENRRQVASEMKVPLAAVERMEASLSWPDRSLNASIGSENTDETQDFLADTRPTPEEAVTETHDHAARARWLHTAMKTLTPREREIIRRRFLGDERTTLAEIGQTYGVTKERIRQIEGKALAKLRTVLNEKFGDCAELMPN
ncbi:MAG: RNA polymerase factor sigma-32 [Gammaproteobacteria bacterium]|nr:RNA polymerase factor sigma-32 [Gammaproteobacteria bacterium]